MRTTDIVFAALAPLLFCGAARAQSDSIHAFVVGRHETTGVSYVQAPGTESVARHGRDAASSFVRDTIVAELTTDLPLHLASVTLPAGRFRVRIWGRDTLTVHMSAIDSTRTQRSITTVPAVGTIYLAPDTVAPAVDHFTASFRVRHRGPDTLGVEWDRAQSAKVDVSTAITLPGSTTSLVFRRGWLRWTLPLAAN